MGDLCICGHCGFISSCRLIAELHVVTMHGHMDRHVSMDRWHDDGTHCLGCMLQDTVPWAEFKARQAQQSNRGDTAA